MAYRSTGQPPADHSPAMANALAEPTDGTYNLGINPETGDYQIGDISATGYHTLRLLAIGSLYAVNNCRDSLHKLGYAHPSDWSDPIPLSHSSFLRSLTPTDVMRIVTKRIRLLGR